jgi:trehalose synthase
VYEVHVTPRSVQPFAQILGAPRIAALEHDAESIRRTLGQRVIWNVNSTASGGGVAEMLSSLLRYARGLKVDVRWLVLEGPPDFFRFTKRLHNALHGAKGDGSPIGDEQSSAFRRVTQANAVAIDALVRPDDLVICHDPQTAGLVSHLLGKGIRVAWRCHIGYEHHDDEVDRGWAFLRPYLEHVPVAVFSRAAYAPAWLRGKRTMVLPPNIDPFSAKNQEMSSSTVRTILANVGLIEGPAGAGAPLFTRDDGSAGRVARSADVVRLGRAPTWDTPLVVQVSRWDVMKDPLGVLEGFARLVAPHVHGGGQLVLAGPNFHGVADDPEQVRVFADLQTAWLALPDSLRSTVHLAMLPMNDAEENAAIVNALQRHATVVVQKSQREGFGLTVTEAMWKRRPVIASAVGGIKDQIRDGVDGLLVHDPANLGEFADLLKRVLADERLATRLGDNGYARVRDNYLSLTALARWAKLLKILAT